MHCRCAAHLSMLCSFALRSFEKYGTRLDAASNEYIQRGVLVNYESLPGYVPLVLLPLFGVSPVPTAWLTRIKAESEYYSKGRGGKRTQVFRGDSEDKDGRATEGIQKYADLILQPSYEELNRRAVEALKSVAPELYASVVQQDPSPETTRAVTEGGSCWCGRRATRGAAQQGDLRGGVPALAAVLQPPFVAALRGRDRQTVPSTAAVVHSLLRYSIADSSLHWLRTMAVI